MLTKKQKEKVGDIAEKYGLKLVLLFGSQVNGRNEPDSDFDIAYLSHTPLTKEQKLDIYNDLGDIFSSDRIDQVNIQTASPLLLHEISRNCQMLFGAELDFIKFKTRAFRIFIDSASLFRLRDRMIEKRHQFLAQRIYA